MMIEIQLKSLFIEVMEEYNADQCLPDEMIAQMIMALIFDIY